ncbi:phosphatidylglycerol--prolipoprotein diacylglyceryl transferase-like isoform X2 [Labrus bergylta]|uniref:phosphatidylglycerol--prolipoprotein diacylglyceryl transferase-like isoform X2 n=1 Tax=Labrus bergylta TaxID=56723 RepID=UPI003313B84A
MGKKKSTSAADASTEPLRKSPRFRNVPQLEKTQVKGEETPASKKGIEPKIEDKHEEPHAEEVETPTENREANIQEPAAAETDDAPKAEEEAEEENGGAE